LLFNLFSFCYSIISFCYTIFFLLLFNYFPFVIQLFPSCYSICFSFVIQSFSFCYSIFFPFVIQTFFLLLFNLFSCCYSIFFPPTPLLINTKEIQKETKASNTYQEFFAELNLSNVISYLMNSFRADVKERVYLYLYSLLCLNDRL
jgi:hypothetical protein